MSINNIIDENKMTENNIINKSSIDSNITENEKKGTNNEDSDINEDKASINYSKLKSKYKQNEVDLKKIKDKINKNNGKIEKIKNTLIKLKEEKNKKQIDIVNLLSKKESIEEVYKNQILLLTKKSSILKDINNKKTEDSNECKYNSNIINNANEQFNISIEEMKDLELNKFIDQVMSMMDEILDGNDYFSNSGNNDQKNNKINILNNLKDTITNSYKLFSNNISLTEDKENGAFIINNFILKISLFISNQSFGKYSENNINLFLRYLLKINTVNVEINKMVKFVNKKYKDEKRELKDEIKKLIKKNEALEKKKKELEKLLDELKDDLENYKYLDSINKEKKKIIDNNDDFNDKLSKALDMVKDAFSSAKLNKEEYLNNKEIEIENEKKNIYKIK